MSYQLLLAYHCQGFCDRVDSSTGGRHELSHWLSAMWESKIPLRKSRNLSHWQQIDTRLCLYLVVNCSAGVQCFKSSLEFLSIFRRKKQIKRIYADAIRQFYCISNRTTHKWNRQIWGLSRKSISTLFFQVSCDIVFIKRVSLHRACHGLIPRSGKYLIQPFLWVSFRFIFGVFQDMPVKYSY